MSKQDVIKIVGGPRSKRNRAGLKPNSQIRRKASVGSETLPPPNGPAAQISGSIPPSLLDRLISFINPPPGSNVGQAYAAIAGEGIPINELLASHLPATKMISEAIIEGLKKQANDTAIDIGFRNVKIGTLSPAEVEIDVNGLRKDAELYRKAEVDVIAAIRLQPVPWNDDPLGFGLEIALTFLFFGPNARASIAAVEAKRRAPRKAKHRTLAPIEWIDASDETAIAGAVQSVVGVSLLGPKIADLEAAGGVPAGWKAHAASGKRALVTLSILSMLPLRKKLIAAGGGKPMLTAALASAEHRLAVATRGREPIVHRDGIPHFWFQEFKRLSLDNIAVPLVMLH